MPFQVLCWFSQTNAVDGNLSTQMRREDEKKHSSGDRKALYNETNPRISRELIQHGNHFMFFHYENDILAIKSTEVRLSMKLL